MLQLWNEYYLTLNLNGLKEDYFKGVMISKYYDFKAWWFQIYYLILFFKLSFSCPYFPYLSIEWGGYCLYQSV
jgi:hypothetical protein